MTGPRVRATKIGYLQGLSPTWDGPPAPTLKCARCYDHLKPGSRPGGMCPDCRDVVKIEQRAAARGIDLAGIDEADWFLLYRDVDEAKRILRWRLLDSIVERVFDLAA